MPDGAAMLGVSTSYMAILIKKGRIHAKRLGRAIVIPVSEIRRLLDEAPRA